MQDDIQPNPQEGDYTPYYVQQLHEIVQAQQSIIASMNKTLLKVSKDQIETNELLRRAVKVFFLFAALSITAGVAGAIPWASLEGITTIISATGLAVVFFVLCCLFGLMKVSK